MITWIILVQAEISTQVQVAKKFIPPSTENSLVLEIVIP